MKTILRTAALLKLLIFLGTSGCLGLIAIAVDTRGIVGAIEVIVGVVLGLITWGLYGILKNLEAIQAKRRLQSDLRFQRGLRNSHIRFDV